MKDLQVKADSLAPWRYDHEHLGVKIKGDPQAAPVHGDYGRGREMMVHIVRALAAEHEISTWRALDLGCLEGHYTEVLCEAGFREVVAIDLSEEHVRRARFLLEELRGFHNVRVLRGSIEDRSFLAALGRFNLILFHGLLYHLENPAGFLEMLHSVEQEPQVLLLSTQFKFPFAEIVFYSAIANVKVRNYKSIGGGQVQDTATASVYTPTAVRLNPWALFRVLSRCGYTDLSSYNTPLGSQYGFQLNLVATRHDHSKLRARLNIGHDIPNFKVYKWDGKGVDSMDFGRNLKARLARFAVRVAYSIAERLGRSINRQLQRAAIPLRHKARHK